jgi:hypothetical protein
VPVFDRSVRIPFQFSLASAHREISSKTNPFVLGPITATTPATKIIATAKTANTAGTPCTSTAPIKIEVNAALNRLQL